MLIRVYYEDTDLGGVVYHSKYFNFCERARSELFFHLGLSPVWEDYHFVVKEIVEAQFFKPAHLGDILEVKTKLLERKKVSLQLLQQIYKSDDLIFSMNIKLVCLKGDRPAKIPHYFLDIFDENHF